MFKFNSLNKLFHIFSAEIIVKIFSFILSIYVVRLLPAKEYGTYQYIIAIYSYFLIVGSFGTDNYALKQIRQEENETIFFQEIFIVKSYNLFFTFIIYTFLVLTCFSNYKLYMITFLCLIFSVFSLDWFMFTRQDSKLIRNAKIYGITSKLIFVLFFLKIYPEAWVILVSDVFLMFVPFFYYTKKLNIHININLFYQSNFLERYIMHMKNAFPFFAFMLVNIIIGKFDIFIIEYYHGLKSVALYSVAYMIIPMSTNITSIFVNLFVPRISTATGDNYKKIIHEFYNYIMVFSFIGSTMLYIFGNYYFIEIFGEKYTESKNIFFIFIVVFILQNISIYLFSLLNAKNHTHINMKISLYVALTNVSLNLFLVKSMSITGAAISMLVSYFFMVILLLMYRRSLTI